MGERLYFPSNERTRFAYWAAVGVAVFIALALLGVVDLSGWALGKLLIAGFLGAVTLRSLRRHAARPLPRLRLSSDGLEGSFGLVQWSDVVEVKTAVDWSLYSRGHDVIVRLRPGTIVRPATREFSPGPLLYDDADISGERLKITRGSLDLSANALAAEIRAYRERYSSALTGVSP